MEFGYHVWSGIPNCFLNKDTLKFKQKPFTESDFIFFKKGNFTLGKSIKLSLKYALKMLTNYLVSHEMPVKNLNFCGLLF